MTAPTRSEALASRFICSLPGRERQLLLGEVEMVDLHLGEVLTSAGDTIRDLYFPCGAVISMVTELEDGRSVEASTVGLEGVVGLPVFLQTFVSSHRMVTQVPGRAAKMPAEHLPRLLASAPGMRDLLARYADATITVMSQAAACLALHPVQERCARWLLMTADRTGSMKFRLTHEFLAQMLGVHRPTVTIAAGMLQSAGLVRYHRGHVEIVDRAGLVAASCECYGAITEALDRVFDIPLE